MPLELSVTAQALSSQTNIEQQLIVEIDGLPVIFTAVQNSVLVKYGQANTNYGDEGLLYGALTDDPNARAWINLSGTTSNIKQQIKSDRGGTASVQKVNVNIVDVAGQVTTYLTPSNFIDDPLSARADVYLAFRGGAHPRDSVLLLSGIIDDVQSNAGSVTLQITHADDLKRAEIYEKVEDELASSITDSDTTITMTNSDGLFESQDDLETYVRINDEVIKVGAISGNNLTGCTRAQFGTIASAHDAESEISSIYRLTGDPITLALKLMLSGGDENYVQSYEITSFEELPDGTLIDNAIYFAGVDLKTKFGVTTGDLVTTTGATNAANNVTSKAISGVVVDDNGTYIIISDVTFTAETSTSATINIKSEYNVLPDGCKLKPREIDVEQHELLFDQFNSSLFNYDFYLKETVKAKEFIDKELYFPSGLFLVPRKGRVSCNITVPPLAQRNTKLIDSDSVVGPDKLRISRSTNTDFYNAVIYRFEEDILEDEFKRGVVTQSATSTNRIITRNKPLVIESKGLRNNPDTLNKIERQTRRFLDRYQFAAESVKSVQVNYKTGFSIEISDSVIFGDGELKVADIKQGNRDFEPRVMEVVNKTFNIKTGKVTLDLLDTAFGVDGRFGSISPSSYVGAGATTTTIPIKRSFGTEADEIEQDKWEGYIGETILVRSPDFSAQEEVQFNGFASGTPNVMQVGTLSFTPLEDYIVQAPNYDLTSQQINRTWKSLHPSLNPRVEITSGTNNFTFDVDDASAFSVGRPVRVHSFDYSVDSTPNIDTDDAKVENIVGTTITVDRDLGFTPSAGQFVDLIAYSDGGEPYRLI